MPEIEFFWVQYKFNIKKLQDNDNRAGPTHYAEINLRVRFGKFNSIFLTALANTG